MAAPMRHRRRTPRAWIACACLACASAACGRIDSPRTAQARAHKVACEKQIAGLEQALARMRQEGGPSRERLVVAVGEQAFRSVLSATLPQEVTLDERVRLLIERAEPSFRYTQGVVRFEGRLTSVDHPGVSLAIGLTGGVERADLSGGRLAARLALEGFEVQGAALGGLGRAVVEQLVRDRLASINAALPPVEIPVRVEQDVALGGLLEGPVTARPGSLPIAASVARVACHRGRLWISLDVSAGPWRTRAPSAPGEARR